MAKHKPGIMWPTRRWDTDAAYQMVSTDGPDTLRIEFMPGKGSSGLRFIITRRDARLLARRIMQCLESTK